MITRGRDPIYRSFRGRVWRTVRLMLLRKRYPSVSLSVEYRHTLKVPRRLKAAPNCKKTNNSLKRQLSSNNIVSKFKTQRRSPSLQSKPTEQRLSRRQEVSLLLFDPFSVPVAFLCEEDPNQPDRSLAVQQNRPHTSDAGEAGDPREACTNQNKKLAFERWPHLIAEEMRQVPSAQTMQAS